MYYTLGSKTVTGDRTSTRYQTQSSMGFFISAPLTATTKISFDFSIQLLGCVASLLIVFISSHWICCKQQTRDSVSISTIKQHGGLIHLFDSPPSFRLACGIYAKPPSPPQKDNTKFLTK